MWRNSGWALLATGVNALALLGETIVLARYLGARELGVLLLIIAFPEAVQKLLDFRVKDAMTRYVAGFLEQGRKADAVAIAKLLWVVDVGVSLMAFAFVAATASLAADLLLNDADLGRLMIVYAIGQLFGALDSAGGSILRAIDRFSLSFIAGSVAAALRFGFVLVAVLLGAGLEGLVWARVAAEVLGTLLLGAVSLRAFLPLVWEHRSAPIRRLRPQFAEIRRFLLSTNLIGIVRTASTKLDTLLVGALGS
ncbi:MAG: oligosaccharide flippase family protein, partial [Thermoleophilaceae bacterium]|nr:oligosaccharide flippase family protein [Thermoleophilaceae bacterium]